jgi:nucleotide-binding universal stress UspA family protein
MIERIVVPLDGSALAEEILPQLKKVLYRADAEVVLVRAVIPPPVEDGVVIAEAPLGVAREYLRGVQDRLTQQGARVTTRTLLGSAAGVILDVAEEDEATMIAMATHGETGLKRLLLGSVAEQVLRNSPVPVLVTRPFWSYELLPRRTEKPEERPLRTILLPQDGSDCSQAIVPSVTEMATLFASRVVLLRVIEARTHSVSHESAVSGAYLNRLSLELEAMGLETMCMVRRGDPAQEILEAARADGVDLIAMATHGRSGISRLVTGSVTEKVLREATCPMLVIRARKSAGTQKEGRSGPLEAERRIGASRIDSVTSS